jgi:hypothetical protein
LTVPDKRRHRGAHPEDGKAFADDHLDALRRAAVDYCWLLSRGYADKSALKLVGDRFGLTTRQRLAVMRCSCSDRAVLERRAGQVERSALKGAELWIDGYNLLTTVESALAGGVILVGRDGCYRDLAGPRTVWPSDRDSRIVHLSLVPGSPRFQQRTTPEHD